MLISCPLTLFCLIIVRRHPATRQEEVAQILWTANYEFVFFLKILIKRNKGADSGRGVTFEGKACVCPSPTY